MKYWKLFIPDESDQDLVAFLITRWHPVIPKLLGLQELEGSIGEGATEVAENIFEWEVEGYRIAYQRVFEVQLLIVDAVETIIE